MTVPRVAIVTGGARGIGAAISETLARDGVHVAMGYSANRAAADDLAGKLATEELSVSVHQRNVGQQPGIPPATSDRGGFGQRHSRLGITGELLRFCEREQQPAAALFVDRCLGRVQQIVRQPVALERFVVGKASQREVA